MKTNITEYNTESNLNEITVFSQENLKSRIPEMIKERNYFFQFLKVNRSKMQFKSELEKIKQVK